MFNSFLLLLIGLFISELVYFRIATKFQIVDRPNYRSSHNQVTIRGGGIIFPISVLLFLSPMDLNNVTFGVGLLIIAGFSFIDDVRNIDGKWRLLIQIIAVAISFFSFFNELAWYCLPAIIIMLVGILNAYNFMDGINGITVLYSLVCLCTLFWVNSQLETLQSTYFFLSILASLLVFAFFNVRKKARCFSGDVGSVSLAFIISYLLLKLILITQWPYWILLLGIYGIDSVFTIVCRIFRKESLMQAHRSHFYQYLVNEKSIEHVQVSIMYAFSQIVLNLIVIYAFCTQQIWLAMGSLFVFLMIYTIFRLRLEGHKRLFVTYNPD
jgi:UDP-N-acetylmuramyl pentapeptide phosphotransferase/UDP-N-acetylglucosamine-1-phosphate transferase